MSTDNNREVKHLSIFYGLNRVDNAIDKLYDTLQKIEKGAELALERERISPDKQPDPTFSQILSGAPDRLLDMHNKIEKFNETLNQLLF